jgi:hypothetical protein
VSGLVTAVPATLYGKVYAQMFLSAFLHRDSGLRPITGSRDGAVVSANCAYRMSWLRMAPQQEQV